jgi:MinD superfamily P-loop ATPase
VTQCPADAIAFPEKHCGEWFISKTRFGSLVHAQLFPGEENSGRLVALLRQKAKTLAKEQGLNTILSDGPPGIGCPVISSLSGASLAIIVTEPTPSGRHDLERVWALCGHFRIPAGVIINKWDLNAAASTGIDVFCKEKGLHVFGRISHDTAITNAMVAGKVITEHQQNGISRQIKEIWANIEKVAFEKKT